MEANIDDVVVKTKHVETLVDDLRLTFDNLRAYDIKLNPEKCIFGVPAGKLLGFIVSGRGIEANPAKIRALSQLDIPKHLKQIQKLTGCVAALSRFISRLGEKALPLYRLLRCTEHFEWTDAAMAGLDEIKAILATNPVLAAPDIGEPMLLYIAATHQVVSAVLVVEREKRMDTNSPFKSRSTMCPLSLLRASHDTRIIKRLCTRYLWHPGSCDTTFKSVQ